MYFELLRGVPVKKKTPCSYLQIEMTIIGQEELSEEEEAAAERRGKTGNQLAPPPPAAVSQLAIGETLQIAIVETLHNAMPYF